MIALLSGTVPKSPKRVGVRAFWRFWYPSVANRRRRRATAATTDRIHPLAANDTTYRVSPDAPRFSPSVPSK